MSDKVDKPITVRIHLRDFAHPLTPKNWASVVEQKLKEAGIPIDSENVLRGTLHRYDDPTDWGVTIYTWTP